MRRAHVITTAVFTTAMSALLLGGCAGSGTPPTTFDLTAPRVMTVTSPKPARFQLVIDEPTATRSLETDRIMIKPGGAQVAYYKDAVWSDRLPHLIQARMIEAFQNTGLVSAVGSRADRLDADIEMASQLRAFHIEINGGQAQAYASLYVKIIDGDSGRMISSRGFDYRVSTSATNVNQMVTSLNEAFDQVLRKAVPWVAKRKI